jgi:hypothetical protein
MSIRQVAISLPLGERCLRVANFRELRLAVVRLRRIHLPRTRVNKRWGPSFSNSLLIETMTPLPLSTAGTHPLFSYI